MNKYLFKTTTTMKDYNCKKWWIDSNIIKDLTITADTIQTALKEYQRIVKERFCIGISDNAIKNRNNMYIDTDNGTIQNGYVITAKSDFFEDRDNYKYTQHYIDLWINISIVRNPFTEVEQWYYYVFYFYPLQY